MTVEAQPIPFEENVRIHRIALIELIDQKFITEQIEETIAYRHKVNAICDYTLENYKNSGSYRLSLELLRNLININFTSKNDTIFQIIDNAIAEATLNKYQKKNLLLD